MNVQSDILLLVVLVVGGAWENCLRKWYDGVWKFEICQWYAVGVVFSVCLEVVLCRVVDRVWVGVRFGC